MRVGTALLATALAACDSNGPPPLVTTTINPDLPSGDLTTQYPPPLPSSTSSPPICVECSDGGSDARDALDAGDADVGDEVADAPDAGDGWDVGTGSDADACAPTGCTGSCADVAAHNVSTVIDGCVVWQCCVPADASAGGDATERGADG